MVIKLIEQLCEQHILQLHELYANEWWSASRSLEQTQSCIAGSQITIGLVDESDRLIGFTRVLTDYTFKAFIFSAVFCIIFSTRFMQSS